MELEAIEGLKRQLEEDKIRAKEVRKIRTLKILLYSLGISFFSSPRAVHKMTTIRHPCLEFNWAPITVNEKAGLVGQQP